MGSMAYTESQCLYKGDLYLYLIAMQVVILDVCKRERMKNGFGRGSSMLRSKQSGGKQEMYACVSRVLIL